MAVVFVLAGPLVGWGTARLAARVEREQAYRACAEYFASHKAAFTRELDETTGELTHLAALFLVSPHASREQFSLFSADILARHPAIAALEWAPRVTAAGRAAHERRGRAEGIEEYRIVAAAPGGGLAVAPARPEYYPVFYVEPFGPNREAVGIDLLSERARRDALVRAAATGAPALTSPLALVEGREASGTGCLGVLPVLAANRVGLAPADGQPDGFVVLELRAGELFDRILNMPGAEAPADMRFDLAEVGADGRTTPLDSTRDDVRAPLYDDWLFVERFQVGGRNWVLTGRPTQTYVSGFLSTGPLLLGIGVTLLWALVGGLAVLLVARARDVAFRRQTRIFETALRSLAEGVVVADVSGRFVLFNETAEAVLGVGTSDRPVAEWSSAYGCFCPDGTTPFPSEELPLARALRGEASTAEIVVRNPNLAHEVRITGAGTPLRDEDGALDGGIIVFRDITEHMRQQDELVRLSNAVEQTADAIMITDPDGVIRYVNPAFETVTGYSRAEAVGETPRLLRSGQQPAEFYGALWKTLLAGEVFRGSPINRRKNGDLYRAEQTITPIKDSEGRIQHFVSVMKDVTDRIRAEQQEIEMRYASAVQRRLYPDDAPAIAGLDIAAATFPALATCGDYYDYLPLPDGSLGVVIGDVSGHGLGPALIMVETRACLHFLAESCATVGDMLTRTNATLYEDLDDERYVALILAQIDPTARRLVYANAGHTSAYHLDGRGNVKAVMDSSGPPAGVLPGVVYGIVENPPLEDGDVVVFLTDGITETEDPSGDPFGAEAAIEVIRANIDAPARDLVQHLRNAARDFARGAPQTDDITLIVCKKLNGNAVQLSR